MKILDGHTINQTIQIASTKGGGGVGEIEMR